MTDWTENDELLLRYSRQIMLPAIDLAGQGRLLESRVLIIGMGGLGSPVAMYLAGAGVGDLTIADGDKVDLTNIHRQIIHSTADIGRPKVRSAQELIQAINPHCGVSAIEGWLDADSLAQHVADADVVVDATDNFATRFAINAACVAACKPLVSGAAIRMEGQISVYKLDDPDSPCYRCLYSDVGADEETCARTGVVGPVVGVIGAMQALEVIKLITGAGDPLVGRLLLFDGSRSEWQMLRLKRDPGCPQCGARR